MGSEQEDSRVQDPLLDCLIYIAYFFDKSNSAKSLTAGLPLSEDHKLNPKLFVLALEKINLTADVSRITIEELVEEDLPCVILLDKNDAYVLVEKIDRNKFKIFQPGNDKNELKELSRSELEEKYLGYAIRVKPIYRFDQRSEAPIKANQKHWFWSVVYKFWPLYGEIAIAALLINIFALAGPIFIMNVYNRIIPVNALESLWALAMGMFIIIGFDFLLRSLRSRFIERAGRIIDTELSDKVIAHVLDLEASERPAAVGSLVNTMQSFDYIRDFIASGTITVLIDFPFVILFLLAIYLLGGWLVLIPLVLMPFALIVGLVVQKKIITLVNNTFRYGAEKNAMLVEMLTNIENVKGMSIEGLMQKKWDLAEKSSANQLIKLRDLVNFSSNFAVFIQQICFVTIIIGGVYKVSHGNFTVGALIACSILGSRVLTPIIQFCGLINRYQQSNASIVAIDKIMKLPRERSSTTGFIHYKNFVGSFEFTNVSFAYKGQPINVLEDINLTVNAGEKIGVIGRTGSGKSTLIKLLMRFYLPTEGYILVDGSNINQIDPAELRSEIGYVPQHVALFYGTIKENIAMHTSLRTPIDDHKIREVAELCNLDKVINAHPEGYNRQVGESGAYLSSGQRQLIAIARSLVIDPKIVLWDEPTNGIDDTTALKLMQNLKDYLENKTLILITHKQNVLFLINRLVVLEEGRIIADGPKDEVLQAIADKKIRIQV